MSTENIEVENTETSEPENYVETPVPVKTVYLFDDDGFYNGTTEAMADPLEYKNGNEVYMLPPNATETAPNEIEGKFCKWYGTQWRHTNKPSEASDFAEIEIKNNPETYHDRELLSLYQSLVVSQFDPAVTDKDQYRPVFQNGRFKAVKVEALTEDEQSERLAKEIRKKRDALLSASDYLVMPDYPLSDEDKQAVVAYRQALRDLPQAAGFPQTAEFPEMPEIGDEK